jgi:hypothetical protein
MFTRMNAFVVHVCVTLTLKMGDGGRRRDLWGRESLFVLSVPPVNRHKETTATCVLGGRLAGTFITGT